MSIPAFIKKSPVAQLIISMTFLISGLIVCLLQSITFLLWPINKNWCRILNCKLVYLHWAQMIWMCDYWAEIELHVHSEPGVWESIGKEHGLLVMNHKHDLDWIIAWLAADRARVLGSSKCLMKNELRYVPLIGWSFLLLEMVFVKRDFKQDKPNLIRGFQNYGSYPLNSVTLLFCEGTRYTKAKHDKSNEFAKKQNIEPFKHHLVPRTKGFTMCIEGFKGYVPAMYDCCIGYDTDRGAAPLAKNLLMGEKMIFHCYTKRKEIQDIPTETEQECADYCLEMYREKDKEYDHFIKHQTFAGYNPKARDQVIPRRTMPLVIEIFWLLLLGVPMMYYMAKILLSGSMVALMSLGAVILIIYIVIRVLLRFTQTAKGSAYGSKPTPSRRKPETSQNAEQENNLPDKKED